MKKSKEITIKKLMEKTKLDKDKCKVIANIMDNNFMVGLGNKNKIVKSIMEGLSIGETEADTIYNKCAEIFVKDIFSKF